jgi:hypothetical protein
MGNIGKRFYKAVQNGLVETTKPRNLVGIARNTQMTSAEGCRTIPQQVAKRYLVGCRKTVTLRRKSFCHVDHLAGKAVCSDLEPLKPPKTAKGMGA